MFTSWVINALALLMTAFIMPGIHLPTSYGAVIGAIYVGITNYSIKPIMSFFSTPVNILTMGAFSWVVDGITLIIVSWFTPDFTIDTYLDAILGSVIFFYIKQGMFMLVDMVATRGGRQQHEHYE